MLVRRFLSTILFCVLCTDVSAQAGLVSTPRATSEERERVAPLLEALGMPELLQIMRQEGVAYSDELETDLFSAHGGERWAQMVSRIYDTDRMAAVMYDEMAADIAAWHLTPLEEFFTSVLGKRIVGLEVSARRALLEQSVEDAALDAMKSMRDTQEQRFGLLQNFTEANDLIEMNVVGALNANYAFMSGLNAAGVLPGFSGEEDILREVWSQEDVIRGQTEDWVYSYLAMAYQPLSDDDIERYIEISGTEAGRALNTALFAAFDELFQVVSYDLGMAAAQFMAGEDL